MTSDPLQQQTVGEFILENEGNLGIAVEVARAFPPIQRQLVQRAMDSLEKQLRSHLGDEWEVSNDREEVLLKNLTWFCFRRKTWGEVWITLEIHRLEEKTFVGLWRDRKGPKVAVLDAAINKAFAKMPGKADRWWAWYQELPAEYGNWNAAPALAAMQFRQSDIVNYWTEQLLLVHKIASPVVDKVVKGK
jgi:hypothetical protein